tara:strand:- start:649 stop:1044 length:396 start_codon:yes stop_codon:yes gene_type:complete
MIENNFPPGFEKEARNIAIDFDGVIHNFDKGFHDGTCYGSPLINSIESIKEISQKYNIIIFTAKAKPSRPLVDGKTGTELVWEWLDKYKIKEYITAVTSEKPRAFLYIDDKGYRFNNWEDTMTFLKDLNYG